MSAQHKLTKEAIAFLETASSLAFANPFSDEWKNLEKKLVSFFPSATPEKIKESLPEMMGNQLNKYLGENIRIENYDDNLRETVQIACLFQVYSKYRRQFDDYILQQFSVYDKILDCTFIDQIIKDIQQYGFSVQQISHYLGIFFQIRRAYFFISRFIAGESALTKKLRCKVWNSICTAHPRLFEKYLCDKMEDFSTLILGETGTGKGSVASAIGHSNFIPFDVTKKTFSENFRKIFIALNLSQYSESLIESELFGHAKGSFTGALEKHDGVFCICSENGAIFLDELGDIPLHLQVKLLKVLQERIFTPIGSHEFKKFKGRVIAATNKSLDELRRKNLFRDDLYYRLCSNVISLPPLRERIRENPSELSDLISHLLEKIVGSNASELGYWVFNQIRKCVGINYEWPGNVRELEQAIRSILVTGQYYATKVVSRKEGFIENVGSGVLDYDALLSGYCKLLYEKLGTLEAVSQQLNIDRRTVKKYITLENKSLEVLKTSA